jgi:hypothetical protein
MSAIPHDAAADLLLSLALADAETPPRAGAAPAFVGRHRFVRVGGRTGYQPLSSTAHLRVPCRGAQLERGTFLLWLAPCETLTVSPPLAHVTERDPHWMRYALLADGWPAQDPARSVFAWYWQSQWHPQMVAKFKRGPAGNTAADFGVTPYVPVEHLPLREGRWYQLALTWDKPASRLRVYVNGILCGTTRYPFRAEPAGDELYLGNPAMVFAGLECLARELTADEVARRHADDSTPKDQSVDEELRRLFVPAPPEPARWEPGPDWSERAHFPFTRAGDLAGWHQQGCAGEPFALRAREVTPEGLLLQTPDEIHTESRMYLWSPAVFEGDLAVALDFRPESATGLALLVLQASGMQREDFLTDHPPRTSGAMDTIIADRVRNYHWEFFRHAVDVRSDLATHVLAKNPWMRPLAMSTQPPLALEQWHRLLFVQEGGRLRAAVDGDWVLEARDDPAAHAGPVLSRGRIGLRLMYGTRMRFRDLRVWNRPHLP